MSSIKRPGQGGPGERFYEMVSRLLKTGTTAEKEYSIANVEVGK